jgi:hypothetical protein
MRPIAAPSSRSGSRRRHRRSRSTSTRVRTRCAALDAGRRGAGPMTDRLGMVQRPMDSAPSRPPMTS